MREAHRETSSGPPTRRPGSLHLPGTPRPHPSWSPEDLGQVGVRSTPSRLPFPHVHKPTRSGREDTSWDPSGRSDTPVTSDPLRLFVGRTPLSRSRGTVRVLPQVSELVSPPSPGEEDGSGPDRVHRWTVPGVFWGSDRAEDIPNIGLRPSFPFGDVSRTSVYERGDQVK